jgi:hypothetical protein
MKPLHAGLLVLGATLAGALAFTLTQRIAIPDPPPLARLNPPLAPAPKPQAQQPKPSPLVAPAAKIIAAVSRTPVETAPAPVYKARERVVKSAPAPKVIAKLPPTQWAPTKYEAAAEPDPAPSAAPVAVPAPEPTPIAPPAPQPPLPRHVTLQTGMTLAVRLDETISSSGATPGDAFQASLSEPLVVDGLVIAERGARAVGRVVDVDRGVVSLALASVYTSDGQRVGLLTDPWSRQSEPSFFFRRAATVPTGTVIHFRISNRVTVTEQQIATR